MKWIKIGFHYYHFYNSKIIEKLSKEFQYCYFLWFQNIIHFSFEICHDASLRNSSRALTLYKSPERQFWPSLPEPQISQSEEEICVIQPIRAQSHGSQQWSWPYMVWWVEKTEGHLVPWCFSCLRPCVSAGLPVMAKPLRTEVVHYGLNYRA